MRDVARGRGPHNEQMRVFTVATKYGLLHNKNEINSTIKLT